MAKMTPPASEKIEAQKRAAVHRFLYRQFFITPPLPQNVKLTGKTAIVTGSNRGLGLESARQLLDLGLSRLIIAVRDESKGKAASIDLAKGRDLEDGAIEVWKLDMLSYDSITAFVERTKTLKRLDIVLLNAGIMKQTHALAPTGHEETVQVNVLSTGLLNILLLPVLKAKISDMGEPGRIVWVQSDTACWANFKEKTSTPLLAALDKPENFNLPDRYGTSKLLGQLFVKELSERVPSSVAIITMAHPGWCYGTSLGELPGRNIAQSIVGLLKRIIGRSASIGARTLTDGAVNHGREAHGQFLDDCKISP
jgi:NAD(P)-dependent dehydrogenase (short-subunit alcohol dehydrogenase family)